MAGDRLRAMLPPPPAPWEVAPLPTREQLRVMLPPPPWGVGEYMATTNLHAFLGALKQFPETWTVQQIREHVEGVSPETPRAPGAKESEQTEPRRRARFA